MEANVPPVLHLPAPNRFICSDFSILQGCSAATLPALVRPFIFLHA